MKSKNKTNMKSKICFGFLVAILSIALLSFASASTLDIVNQYVEIDGLPATGNNAVVSSDKIPVVVDFTANSNASEVQVSAWVQGFRSDRSEIEFADLIDGSDYSARLAVNVPSDIDPEEELTLFVRIETDNGNWEESYTLRAQRQSNALEVLLVDMDSTVSAGASLPIGVVVKNIGRHESEDTMVTVRIPELGISKTAYLEDLAILDSCDDNCDNEDSIERKLLVTIPSNAESGVYKVEISTFNDKTETTVVKTLTVSEKEIEGRVLANPSARSFAVGEEAVYELVLVNSGDKMEIYNLASTLSDALTITLSDSVAAVPAGSSKTVKIYVDANREGTFGFAVNVNSDNGFSGKVNYTAMVKDKAITNNNLIVLTIALAIIFVVLVIVLVVLLTRKPQKSEEFGESYY
ncbi:MAG TPA: hypothetical protein P5277_01530 [Candidatus Paceibacterota bacterium]|nr:hypothetical protein [Candidatus Paceibacterota bacterium]